MSFARAVIPEDSAPLSDRSVEEACAAFYGAVWFSERDTEFARHRPRLREAMRKAIGAALRTQSRITPSAPPPSQSSGADQQLGGASVPSGKES